MSIYIPELPQTLILILTPLHQPIFLFCCSIVDFVLLEAIIFWCVNSGILSGKNYPSGAGME